MKIIVNAVFETSWNGAKANEDIEIEVPDNVTEEEMDALAEEAAREWAGNYYSIGYQIVSR